MSTIQECLAELDSISLSTPSADRRTALRAITDLFLVTADRMNEDHADLFGDAMARVAVDVDQDSRSELSARIAKRPQTPRNLAFVLANDEIKVAQPILEHTKSLTSDDLVALAKTRSQDHLNAIAKREELAPQVTDVLVERGETPVLHTVSRNHGAQFSQAGMETLVQRADTDLDLNEAITARRDLAPDVRSKVQSNVVRAFEQEQTGSDFDISLRKLSETSQSQQSDFDRELKSDKHRTEVAHLHRSGHLKEETVVRFAQARRVGSTLHAIAVLADLDPDLVGHCIYRSNPMALAILCQALGFSKTTMWCLVELRKLNGPLPANFAANASQVFEAVDIGRAQRILRFLKVRLANANIQAQAA